MLTEEQKKTRQNGIGGSDLAVLLGLNPYRTLWDLYNDKVHGSFVEETESMFWGNALEDPIAERYSELTGQVLLKTDTFIHPEYPFLIANPDRIINDTRKGLEIKTVGPRQAYLWGESGSKIIPEYYYPQIMHYLFVLDFESWDVAALINGQELRVYTFERDKEFDKIILEKCKAFWKNHVEPKIPPEINYSDPNALRIIRQRYKEIQPESVELFHVEPWVEIYLNARDKIKEYEKILADAQVHILAAMEEAEKGLCSNGGYFQRKKISVKGYTVPPKEYISFGYKAKETASE